MKRNAKTATQIASEIHLLYVEMKKQLYKYGTIYIFNNDKIVYPHEVVEIYGGILYKGKMHLKTDFKKFKL